MKKFFCDLRDRLKNGMYKRHYTAPLLVLAIFILMRVAGRIDTVLTRENEYAAGIIMQLLIFLFPAAVYLAVTRQSLKSMRVRIFNFSYLLLLLASLIALISGNLLINYLFGGYDTLTGGYDLYGVFVAKSDGSFADTSYLVLAYAFVPAVCEEFVFRSVLCAEYERRSSLAAIIMPALFFAMLHFELARLPALFFSGVLLGITMYATRSLLGSFAVHFSFNLVSVFGRPVFQTLYDLGGKAFFVFLLTSTFLFSLFIFFAECARFYKNYSEKNMSSEYRTVMPPYEKNESDRSNPLTNFSAKYPRVTATLSSIFSPTAFICYLFYVIVILFG